MPLVYLPDAEALFLWGQDAASPVLPALGRNAQARRTSLVTPEGRRAVEGVQLGMLDATAMLAAVPTADLEGLPASVAIWTLASKLALELTARERVVPTLARHGGRIEARWAAALSAAEDAARVAAIAWSMPPAAHAAPATSDGLEVWAPDALLRAYLDAVVDALVRAACGAPVLAAAATRPRRAARAASTEPWDQRWQSALTGAQRSFEAQGFGERSVVDDLARWSEPALGARDRLRACFRLELPAGDREPFVLRFLLQSPDDPSLIVEAADVWKTQGPRLEKLGRAFRDPQESLLAALGRAARLCPEVAPALESARPEAIALDPAAAWTFLGDGAAALAEAGFGVIVPSELTALVRRFQEEPRGPRVFVLSVKAGGTGLNLTAANHVFHFDRWWNPAVEDQATDRAYRIGQMRAVQVHKLVCAGTVEERIDRLLEAKRDLAAKVVGKGEQWITELGARELRELFALSEGAAAVFDDESDETDAPRAAPRRRARAPRREVHP
jgi:hypothetical protein